MDFNEIIGTALPIVYVVVGIVLVWLIVELVLTVRRTRQTVDDMQKAGRAHARARREHHGVARARRPRRSIPWSTACR